MLLWVVVGLALVAGCAFYAARSSMPYIELIHRIDWFATNLAGAFLIGWDLWPV